MWRKHKRKRCFKKVKCCQKFHHDFHHDCFDKDCECDEGTAIVAQNFCTGTVNGTTNVFTPVFTNVGDATVFNRSNANGYNNTA